MSLTNIIRNYTDRISFFIISRIIDRKFWKKAKNQTREFLTQQTRMIKRSVERLNKREVHNPFNLEGLKFHEDDYRMGEIEGIIKEQTGIFEHICRNQLLYQRDAPEEFREYLSSMNQLDRAINRHDPDWPIL